MFCHVHLWFRLSGRTLSLIALFTQAILPSRLCSLVSWWLLSCNISTLLCNRSFPSSSLCRACLSIPNSLWRFSNAFLQTWIMTRGRTEWQLRRPVTPYPSPFRRHVRARISQGMDYIPVLVRRQTKQNVDVNFLKCCLACSLWPDRRILRGDWHLLDNSGAGSL